jgi:peptidoglycan/xylan/chitin deacetylase (PgdA/CDA1 family)
MRRVKYLARAVLLTPPGRFVARLLAPGTSTIVMLHRFTNEPASERGFHTVAELRALLATLRANRVPVVSLLTLIQPDAGARSGGVAFTVDDGFADFARVAWPVFREFDCPATVFLTTGFLDGQLWPWWEQVLWAFRHTRSTRLRIVLNGAPHEWTWRSEHERARVADQLLEALKRVPDADRSAAISALPEALDATIPERVPDEHAPLSWADVRAAAREGATFGPHTVTHPILSRVDAAQAQVEIATSWQRVRGETDGAIPVFCYPNGDPSSFGPRDVEIVRQQELSAAVSAIPGNVTGHDLLAGSLRRFTLPRFACPHDGPTLRWLASGWEQLRA